MQTHLNFFPPAGSVIDYDDVRLAWSGSAWVADGAQQSVPSGHRLIGTPGGPLAGWYYDWQRRAWIEPDDEPPQPRQAAAFQRGTQRVVQGVVPHAGLMQPAAPAPPRPAVPQPSVPAPATAPQPAPAPPAPAPQPQPQPEPEPPAPEPAKELCSVTNPNPQNVFENLMKHPVAPLLGGGLLLVSYITDEPVPPVIPADLPETIQKQVQMLFNQNQQRFSRRMDLYRDLGMMLMGYAGTQSVVEVLGHARALHDHRLAELGGGLAALDKKVA